MPSLPRSPFGRRGRTTAETAPERTEPRVEIIESPGLRWINIERPRSLEQSWLEEHFDFHALDLEDVRSRNQRPKVDEYDDYLFIVLHFPRYDKKVSRLNAAEVDFFVGPDFLITLPNEPVERVEDLFERCRTQRGVPRPAVLQGLGLPALQDRRRLRGRRVPDAGQDRQQARAHRGGDLRGRRGRRGRARHLQRQAGDHQLPQDRPAAARRLPRPRAQQGALHRRGPRHLLRRHHRRVRARLGHARELQGGRRGPRGHQRVGDRAPHERDLPGPDRDLADLPAADADRQHLRHERARPVRGARRTPSGSSSRLCSRS